MADKITLRFELDNLQKIGFDGENLKQDFFEDLQNFHESGIEIDSRHFDDLCKNTINNGHNLLKSNGIFNIDTAIVNPMSKVIGQYLFRLLFGNTKFQNILHRSKKFKKDIEIVLRFDLSKPESKDLANLPWELMYCPENNESDDDEEDYKEDGFFVSQVASIYRKYKEISEEEIDVKREVYVAVAFLPKDVDNLKEAYLKLREIAANVEMMNSNIHFEFVNSTNKDDPEFHLLSKEDLGKIFLSDKNSTPLVKINKIVHIICDISTTEYAQRLEKSFYFNKTGSETESISFPEIFKELFNKTLLQDPSLKLFVLQAWDDEKNVYLGFEEIASRIIKKNQTAIISMPYVLNQGKSENGKAAFFETLYSGLANSLSIVEVVQKLRNSIVQKYSYGFPLFYLNGQDQVLVSKENISQAPVPVSTSKNPDSDEEEYMNKYKYLDKKALEDLQKTLKEKKAFIIKESQLPTDLNVRFSNNKNAENVNTELSVIELLLTKASNS